MRAGFIDIKFSLYVDPEKTLSPCKTKVTKEEYAAVCTHFRPLYRAVSTKGKLYKGDLDKSTFRKDTGNKGEVVPRNHAITLKIWKR